MIAPQLFTVGEATCVISESPIAPFASVFEDDGETGYFYAMSLVADDRILTAVHIYNVMCVVDRDRPSEVEIIWSADGAKSALLINRYPHAVFDFAERRGYCRTGFPGITANEDNWPNGNHEWDDSAMQFFNQP